LNGTVDLFKNEISVIHDNRHDVEFLDSDKDNLTDSLSWNVPRLSEQNYLIRSSGIIRNITVFVEDLNGNRLDLELKIEKAGARYHIEIPRQRSVRPGSYKLVVKAGDTTTEQLFKWGLVNINTHKSIYLPEETAKIIIGVLNSEGGRVDDADVSVVIENPYGEKIFYSTLDGTIENNNDGTYDLEFLTKETGFHKITATAVGRGVNESYETNFEVRNFVEFDIEREMPTVIELKPYIAKIKITSRIDAENVSFTEVVPKEFEVTSFDGTIKENEDNKTIQWVIGHMEENETRILKYSFNPPKISPMLYLSGPGEVEYYNESGRHSFKEARSWTIAADKVEIVMKMFWYHHTFIIYHFKSWFFLKIIYTIK